MDLLSRMPEAPLVSILLDWLSLKDFARLDSALCIKMYRAELHQSILASRHTKSEEWVDYKNPKAEWLIKRGIRCRAVRLWQDLVTDTLLREQFLIHSGRELRSLHLKLTERISDTANSLRKIVHGLTAHCTGLKEINISMAWNKYVLSSDDFAALHTFVLNHPILKSLTLNDFKHVPQSFVLMALSQLTFLSLESCAIAKDVKFAPLSPRTASFRCVYTPLPRKLRAYVTDLTTNDLHHEGRPNRPINFASYSNICRATVSLCDTFDLQSAHLVCNHWDKLVYLYLRSLDPINEQITLLLIKQLPALMVLSTAGGAEVIEPPGNYAPQSSSHLYALCMHCNQTSTLEQVLQLCPQLTRLSLQQPKRLGNAITTYVPVERSLHLLRNTGIRALYLTAYDDLCDEDLVALQRTDLHTLSIVEAGINLNDKAILALLPTLLSLTTFDISYCRRLSHELVLQVPPLCPSLRSYTYYKPANRCCGDESDSSAVLDKLLPKFFPHVKEFCIHC